MHKLEQLLTAIRNESDMLYGVAKLRKDDGFLKDRSYELFIKAEESLELCKKVKELIKETKEREGWEVTHWSLQPELPKEFQ